uniref:Uncharacterized protein n=1 Tax=Alexandrium catenella TaxID=2925 RepID=A0A7S1RXI5_ALECA|mmetsp:Transcript_74994/g.199151  ORF Transcript_74994/g.199151 Transcript_74994/m.199151 type:complete len:460 (+) Transcript_74994:3-1382(+)
MGYVRVHQRAPPIPEVELRVAMDRRLSLDRALSLPKTKSWTRTKMEAVAELTGRSVEVDRLRELGFTPDDLARKVYEKVQTEELPNFLRHIQIDADGGMDKIGDMWDQQKVLWFSILVGSVCCNVASLILLNWTLCQSFLFFVERVCQRHETLRHVPLVEPGQVHASWLKLDLEKHMPEPHLQARFLTVAVLVAFFEVAWVVCSVLRGGYFFVRFIKEECEYESFASIVHLLQDILPRMSTFSSISLMSKVHASLIYSDYQEAVEQSSCRNTRAGLVLVSLGFFLSRGVCAVAAVCGFSIKMVATTLRLVNPKYGSLVPWLYVMALINQCMGSVLVERVLQDRIFLFIFGGHDTSYQDDERALRSAYMCRVAKEIWRHYWKGGQRFKAVVLLATFDHYDLQRLIIEDLEEMEATLSGPLPGPGPGCGPRAISKCLSMPLANMHRASSLERRLGETTFGV